VKELKKYDGGSLSKSMKKLTISSWVQLGKYESYLKNKRYVLIRKGEDFFWKLKNLV